MAKSGEKKSVSLPRRFINWLRYFTSEPEYKDKQRESGEKHSYNEPPGSDDH